MSSEIVPGVDTMALAERAWHGYGTVVGRNLTYNEALRTAGLEWSARLAPLTSITPNGVAEVDTHRATYRSDTGALLGVVGADYRPHQPAELLELARLTIDASADDGHVEVIGSLRGGRTVFITIALPGDVNIAGDVHVPRLVWVTSMDGTIATRAVATYVRAVCANTIRASFRSARTSWAARHTSSLAGRTDDARRALQLVWKVSDTFRAEVEELTRQAITDTQADQVLTGLWPDQPGATARSRDAASRRRAEVRRMYRSDPRVAGWHGTAYGLVQAVSTWELWDSPRRGARGEQVLGALFAGTRTRADHAAERLAALA
ncbi:MAG: DUF932 domain-containing protein [Ilumatobacteraceae bacterium]